MFHSLSISLCLTLYHFISHSILQSPSLPLTFLPAHAHYNFTSYPIFPLSLYLSISLSLSLSLSHTHTHTHTNTHSHTVSIPQTHTLTLVSSFVSISNFPPIFFLSPTTATILFRQRATAAINHSVLAGLAWLGWSHCQSVYLIITLDVEMKLHCVQKNLGFSSLV